MRRRSRARVERQYRVRVSALAGRTGRGRTVQGVRGEHRVNRTRGAGKRARNPLGTARSHHPSIIVRDALILETRREASDDGVRAARARGGT